MTANADLGRRGQREHFARVGDIALHSTAQRFGNRNVVSLSTLGPLGSYLYMFLYSTSLGDFSFFL